MSTSLPVARICLLPHVSGVGGMVTFTRNFTRSLAARNIQVTHDLNDLPYDAVLIIGGTKHIVNLWKARQKGIRIVQRLDGLNWLHRVSTQKSFLPTGLRHYLRSEYGNLLLSYIRSRFAHRIIYQSKFAQKWWDQVYGASSVANHVIYNGVDIKFFSPLDHQEPPSAYYRLLMVEGSLSGGYEQGLETAIKLAQSLSYLLKQPESMIDHKPVELLIIGRTTSFQTDQFGNIEGINVIWQGEVPAEMIPQYDRTAHLLYSADINPACPNSVLEALACSLPVLAFDTGAIPEIVTSDSGIVVPYGANPWSLQKPDVQSLARAALKILSNQASYRLAARQRAEQTFSLERMIDNYLRVLLDD